MDRAVKPVFAGNRQVMHIRAIPPEDKNGFMEITPVDKSITTKRRKPESGLLRFIKYGRLPKAKG